MAKQQPAAACPTLSFEEFVKGRLSATDYENLKDYLGSAHMRTRVLANPEGATMHQVLLFAKLLELPAYELVQSWQMGHLQLTDLEREALSKLAT